MFIYAQYKTSNQSKSSFKNWCKILQYLKKSNNENLKTYTIFGRLFLLFFLKILCGSGGVWENSALFFNHLFFKTSSVIIYFTINLNSEFLICKYRKNTNTSLAWNCHSYLFLIFAFRNEVRIITRLHLTCR